MKRKTIETLGIILATAAVQAACPESANSTEADLQSAFVRCTLERGTALITTEETTAKDCPYIGSGRSACISFDETTLPLGTLATVAPRPGTTDDFLKDLAFQEAVRVEFIDPITGKKETSWVNPNDLDWIDPEGQVCSNSVKDEVKESLFPKID